MVKSYDDPIKQKAREAQKGFIKRNLSFVKPKDIRVLCFPGAEQEGQVALEVKEIYFELGIPPGNITGLELDRERYERLVRANLGIELHHCSDVEFLSAARKNGRKWTVISLDYTSFFTERHMYALDLIVGDALLGNYGVFVTNFLGKRENGDSQDLLQNNFQTLKGDWNMFNVAKSIEERTELELSPFNLRQDRSSILRGIVQGQFSLGNAALYHGLYREFLSLGQFVELFLSRCGPYGVDEDLKVMDGRTPMEVIARHREYRNIARDLLWTSLIHNGLSSTEALLYFIIRSRPYFLDQSESYSYVSNSGSPMLFDLFFFNKHESELRPFQDFLSFNPENKTYSTWANVSPKKELILKERAREIVDRLEKKMIVEFHSIEERVHLGSSYSPGARKPKISTEDARYLVIEGVPIKEILDTFSGVTVAQLRAFKAHNTMGTYQKNRN